MTVMAAVIAAVIAAAIAAPIAAAIAAVGPAALTATATSVAALPGQAAATPGLAVRNWKPCAAKGRKLRGR